LIDILIVFPWKKKSPIDPTMLLKKINFFYFKLIFLIFLDRFDMLILKIIFLKNILIHFQTKNILKTITCFLDTAK
jgi:hypothetical protein